MPIAEQKTTKLKDERTMNYCEVCQKREQIKREGKQRQSK